MKDRSASWMTLGLVFLLALSTFWLDYAVKLPQLRPVSKGHNIDFIIDGLHATSFSAQGKPESTLSAQTMIHYPDDNTLWMTAPDFTQIKQNKPTMTITAKRGKLLNNTRQIYFMDRVKIQAIYTNTEKNWVATTQFLHVDPHQDYADTDQPIQIKGQNTLITAGGMNINTRTRIAHLLQHVQVTYH